MASKIHVLSEQTINQIAAGEVIENPASVVKELVENAVDAGASRIVIEVLAGGFQRIKVSDNGCGMSPEDAVLSLQRHATSKIVSVEDLFSLSTMGFRGEALASIAAVSKMTLTTAMENSTAVTIEVEGGKMIHVGPAARPQGTTVDVRSLFYNVPARKKFQKSRAVSNMEITKTVTQLALAYPEIGIELIQHNRYSFSLPMGTEADFLTMLKKRVEILLNPEFLLSSRSLEFKNGTYEGKGLISDPLHSRHNRSGQYLFINRRAVQYPMISYVVQDAYGTRLSPGRYPVYVIHLSIPASLIDVNVHPQKKEVRLRDEKGLKTTLHPAVHAALSPAVFRTEVPFSSSFFAFSEPQTAIDFTAPLCFKEERSRTMDQQQIPFTHSLNILAIYGKYLIVEAQSLSSLFSKQMLSGIVWFDLPAVEARLHYDALIQQLEEETPLSQGLLIPATLSFSRRDAQILNAHLEWFQKLGLHIRLVGNTVFLVEAIPPGLEAGEVHKVLEEFICELQELEEGDNKNFKKIRKLASSISKRARLRKKNYTLEEARLLIERLITSPDPYHCPQGRKTLFFISEEDIAHYFQ